MKIGVIQGRLLPPVNGKIQESPLFIGIKKTVAWEKEFRVIKKNGLSHIEWVISENLSAQIKSLEHLCVYLHKSEINSVCCDNLINEKITDSDFLAKELRPCIEFAIENRIKSVTIPLLESSKISISKFQEFAENILHYGKVYPEIEFWFEMDAPYQLALELVRKSPNFFLTFDTGNITTWGYEPSAYIFATEKYIKNVHLKDTRNGVSVEPGTGHTEFELIFSTLKGIKYDGIFTIQTARGETGKEIETIKRHKKYFESLYESV